MPSQSPSRHNTPPSNDTHLHIHSNSTNRFLDASSHSHYSGTSSPLTPPRSPNKHAGPTLLPKIRKQDQTLHTLIPVQISTAYQNHPASFSTSYTVTYDQRFTGPDGRCRSLSPPECSLVTPISNFTSPSDDCSPSPEFMMTAQSKFGHSRSISAPASHFGFKPSSFIEESSRPTLSHHPNGQVSTTNFHPPSQPPHGPMHAVYGPSMPPYVHGMYPQLLVPATPHPINTAQPSPLSAELVFDNYSEAPPTTTLLDYLTAQNPSPSLVRSPSYQNRFTDKHFWWDIRNLVAWDDFNLAAINQIPDLSQLLSHPLPSPALPHPGRLGVSPETLQGLHDMYTAQFGTRINAALKVSLGHSHLTMTAQRATSQPGAPKQVPDFVANYIYDTSPPSTSSVIPENLPANPQARVVGLVRSYETWNSGMRTSTPTMRINYLRELSLLQHHMRSHGCRYGFIISEIELVCVRMGRLPTVPIFGLLELAEPVQLATHGRPASMSADPDNATTDTSSSASSGTPGLTVGLALWYLHMLAKNEPMPGQCGWRIDIGPPAALSRRNVLPKDAGWIGSMKPEGREKRDAKRNRGWVFPEDALSTKKEAGRPKRWTKRLERERLESQGHR